MLVYWSVYLYCVHYKSHTNEVFFKLCSKLYMLMKYFSKFGIDNNIIILIRTHVALVPAQGQGHTWRSRWVFKWHSTLVLVLLGYWSLFLLLGLWDTLLEGRIKLQKAVSIVNQLPQKQTWTEFEQTSDMFEEESLKGKFCPEKPI